MRKSFGALDLNIKPEYPMENKMKNQSDLEGVLFPLFQASIDDWTEIPDDPSQAKSKQSYGW